MDGLINSQVKDTDPLEVYELILDKFRGSQISVADSSLLSKFSNLEYLSLNLCGLKSLENFPVLPNLIKLELCDNKLKSNLQVLNKLTSLTILSLAGNQIADIQELAPLSALANLKTLDLFGNPLTSVQDYSRRLFDLFKNLQVLDGCDKNGEEVSVASEEESEGDEDSDEDSNLEDFIDDEDEEPVKRPRKGSDENEVKCKNDEDDSE